MDNHIIMNIIKKNRSNCFKNRENLVLNMVKNKNKNSPYTNIFPSIASVQFSSDAQSCPTLCEPMDCRTPGLPIHHQLKIKIIELVMPSTVSASVISFSSCLQSFPASGSFQMSQFFASGSQSTGLSASAQSFKCICMTDFL